MIRFLRSDLAPPAGNNWGGFANPDYDALFLFVAHDLNPRAMHRRVQSFVQARSWFQDLTPVCVAG